jgi:hypothetical protein
MLVWKLAFIERHTNVAGELPAPQTQTQTQTPPLAWL